MHRFLVPDSSQPCPKEIEPSSPPPIAPQQDYQETSTTTPTGQNIQVTLERVSEGGTRRTAHFSRAAPESQAMTAAERGRKTRAVASLYPEKQAARRAKDTSRKRERSAMAQDTMRQPAIELSEAEEEPQIEVSEAEEEPQPSRQEPQQPSHQDPCYYCQRYGSKRCDRCPWGQRRDTVNRAAEWLCSREEPEVQCTMKELLSALQAEDRWFRVKMREFRAICRPYRYHVQMDWLRTYLDHDRFSLQDREVHML
jgi:hypothetical protein